MNFFDLQLKDCHRTYLRTTSGLPAELCEVSALIGVHDVFRMLEGAHSSRVHEAIDHLLSAAQRPALRR